MATWPDQELRSHMKFGVRYGADLPFQLVLTPQLKSLAFAFDRTQSELRDLVDKGWYALFECLPFFPLRMHPKGATERKLENRPRPPLTAAIPAPPNASTTPRASPFYPSTTPSRRGVTTPSSRISMTKRRMRASNLASRMVDSFVTWKHASARVPLEYKPHTSRRRPRRRSSHLPG